MELLHGGDLTTFRNKYGREPLDFSASLNPFGMPETVRAALHQAVEAATPYPDPLCRELAAALARRLEVAEKRIFIGNGAADIIFRLVSALKPKSALIPAPSFAEYERALATADCTLRRHLLLEQDGFRLRENILPEITPGLDLLFLCQPNNPTGSLIDPGLLRRILARTRECGAYLVVDECFLDFTDQPRAYSLVDTVSQTPGLLILGSFTKLYGIAGVRLGYTICGDPAITERLHQAGQPWAVSTFAQAAGLAALAAEDYVRDSLAFLRAERRWLKESLRSLPLNIFGSEANYLFFYTERHRLGEELAEQGILIRDCRNFPGLGPGFYRVAVKTRPDNLRLLQALHRLLAQ